MSKPRMDVTIIIPTKMKEICWDQNLTCDREREREQNRKRSKAMEKKIRVDKENDSCNF